MSDEQLFKAVQGIFSRADFIQHLEISLKGAGEGWCETQMPIRREHRQQHGHIHAGVISTLADHTCGGAARTSVAAGKDVITIEFKINFLSPASGDVLYARGNVLRAGKKIVVAEADVFSQVNEDKVRVAKCMSTLAVIEDRS